MNFRLLLPIVLLAALAFTGCETTSRFPFLRRHTAKVSSIDNTSKFMVLGEPTPPAVHCTGLQERLLADGRLEVVANVRNGEARPLRLRVTCVFKDDHGQPLAGAAQVETITVAEGETRVVRFAAPGDQARDYSLHVATAP